MKRKNKWFAAAGVTILFAPLLVACGSTSKLTSSNEKVYNYVYATDPDSLDYLLTSR